MRRGLVVGGVALAAIAAVLVTVFVLRPQGPDWSTYPGSPLTDPREVLAAPSAEAHSAEMDAFVTELTEAISAEFPVTWIVASDASEFVESNGFGGKSLLVSRYSPIMVGALTGVDPAQATRVAEIFAEVTARYGGTRFEHSNTLDIYDGQDAYTTERFGAPWGEPQAVQRYSDQQEPRGTGTRAWFMTYDPAIPTGEGFEGWDPSLRVQEAQLEGVTLYVQFHLHTGAMLPTADRPAFIERIAGFDEGEKPVPDFLQ